MLNNISLKWKGVLIILVATVSLLFQAYLNVENTRNEIMHEKEVKLKEIVDLTKDIAEYYDGLAKQGVMSQQEAREIVKNLIRPVRYTDHGDYVFIFSFDGTGQVIGPSPKLEGSDGFKLEDAKGFLFIKDLVAAAKDGGGAVNYIWSRDGKDTPKLSYAKAYEPWEWMIASGVYIDDVQVQVNQQIKKTAILITIILVIMAGITFYILNSIIKPVLQTAEGMYKIANQESVEIANTERKDELGHMARTLLELKVSVEKQREMEKEMALKETQKAEEQREMMNKVADRFQDQVGSIAQAIGEAAKDMQGMAASLAAASEETSQNSTSVASATEQASMNVQTVAAAAEELSASIQELVRNMSDTNKSTLACSDAAKVSQRYLQTLQASVDEIDGVIQSINDVAEQTNLLALNATIEAARAGDAGKGFAVVANEVKTLANETNKMTEEIAKKVQDIKNSAAETIDSVQDIITQITTVSDRTTSISAAIEEQNASTAEISRNAQEAATGTTEVSNSIVEVQKAANDTAASTELLRAGSDNMANQSAALKEAISRFVAEIRA